MVKETMKRKKPSFNESYYGFRTFSQLLEDAQKRGIVILRRDQKSGSYVVEDLGAAVGTGVPTRPELMAAPRAESRSEAAPARSEPAGREPAAAAAEGDGNGQRTRRRRSRGRGRGKAAAAGAGAEGTSEAGTAGSEEGPEIDDHDESDEETVAAEAGNGESAPAPAEPASAQTPEQDEPTPPRPERPFLSLFSWVRRDRPEDE
jgi:hypothetical protein